MRPPSPRRPTRKPGRRLPARLLASVGLCGLALHAAPAVAGDDDPPQGFARTLTGDWGGTRTRLRNSGVSLTLGYVSEAATNPRGGSEERTRYADQWSFGARVDLKKLIGRDNATFELVITDRNGRNLGDDAQLNTLQGVQEVYGRGQTWRLTRLSYRQTWFDGGIDLKLGRLPVGDDFASFACDFQNLTFCGSQPGNVRGELWYSYPVSQWGVRAKVVLDDETSVQLGLYQVNPRYVDDSYAHHDGLYPSNPSGTTGALVPLEIAWTPAVRGLPGAYKVGAWYDTSNADDVLLDANRQSIAFTGGSPLRRDSRSGVYVNFQQQVTGPAKGRGITLFLNVTQSDRNTAVSMDRQIAFGLTYRGPFDARPGDSIGLAVGSNHVNSRVAERVRLTNGSGVGLQPVPGSETVGELFYAWTPLPFLSVQPNLQYVRHPGGLSSSKSVVVIGLRTSVAF